MNETDRNDIVATAVEIIETTLTDKPLLYSEYNFETYICELTFDCLVELFEPIQDLPLCDIESAVEHAFVLLYPQRSYPISFVINAPKVSKLKSQLSYLQNVPQPDQRTDEWYHFRSKYLTASSIWKAFGSEKSRNELIYNKCKPVDIEKYKTVNVDSAMHWGQKYEPISVEWYEREYKTGVSDFGCIPHKRIEYLAASPDGIVTDETSDRYGRMLEIKNIVNRDITGIPKTDYWIQMQLQMEVCDLDECDFLETRFIEYDNYVDFKEDGTFNYTKENKPKGIIMYFDRDGIPLYEYAPIGISEKEFEHWEQQQHERHKNITWVTNLYWRLEEVSCVLVLRNHIWFQGAKPILDDIWGIIQREKVEGCEHRAPNKISRNTVSVCLL